MIFVETLLIFVLIAFIWLLVTLIMFKKLNKTRVTGVLLIFLAFIGVAVVIFTVGHFLEWHETNEFCADMCHAMEGPYESYSQPKNNTMMEVHYEEDIPCAQCHSGPGFIGLGKSFLPVPNEMLHQYLLGYDEDDFGGHVPAENCIKGCHEEAGVDWKFEAPMPKGEGYNEINGEIAWKRREIFHPLTADGTSIEELKKLETCLKCHDARDNSFGLTSETCYICHDIEDEEMEAHGQSTCSQATCHRDADGNPVQPKLTGHNTVTDHCMECHSRDHPDDAFVPYTTTNSKGTTFTANSTFCADCHHETYEELSITNPKHFQENDCTECHLEHKTRPDCLLCHDSDAVYPTEHNIVNPFDDCTSCHVEGGHNPKKVTFSAQDSGIVSRGFCNNTACHKSDVYDKIEDGKLHTQESFTEDCLECHEEHEADLECTSCHRDGGLAPEPEHNVSVPFDECSSCHTEGHDPEDLNFTFFEESYGLSIGDDFCEECHTGERTQLSNFGLGHADGECSSCHVTHEKEDVDCFSCHNDQGPAFEPTHDIQPPYMDCTSCHVEGHAPKNISFELPVVARDFCAEVSCHGGPEGAATIFEDYGANHELLFDECTDCHSLHEVDKTCTDSNCHSNKPSTHNSSYSFEQCVDCHKSAHDPLKRSPRPGSALSQRDYMSAYYQVDIITANSFNWIERGNHGADDVCANCHTNSETNIYPASAQLLLNVSRVDCAGSCHEWLDPVSTGTPISLINNSLNPFSMHFEIFNSSSSGGCAGTCHQKDPSTPVYDGTGHGTITTCLDDNCHGGGDFDFDGGYLHQEHEDEDMLSYSSLQCSDICHKGTGMSLELIDGGCYDCHKSGHDPRIMTTSSCYVGPGCHGTNQP